MTVPIYHALDGALKRYGRASIAAPPPADLMFMGMYNTCTRTATNDGQAFQGDTPTNWRTVVDDHMDPAKVHLRRCFNSSMPTSWANSAGAGNTALGITSWLSMKAQPQQVTAGTYDANIDAIAAGAPAGTCLIYFHEPENDVQAGSFTALEWAAAFKRFHQRVKAANPNVYTAVSHMTYQWGSGMASTATPAQWSVDGNADFLCTDTYFMEFTPGYMSVADEPRHQRWHDWAKTEGIPLGITEFGIVHKFWTNGTFTRPYTDAQRATLLGNSLDWFHAQGYKLVLYWNSYHAAEGGGYRDWNLTDTGSDPEDYPLSLGAWNDRVAAYGSSAVTL